MFGLFFATIALMFHIIAGEDTSRARARFVELKKSLQEKGITFTELTESSLDELGWKLASPSLFESPGGYVIDSILHKKKVQEKISAFDLANTHLIGFDTKSYEPALRRMYPTAQIEFFKLPTSLFSFLDSFTPGKAKYCVPLLKEIMTDENDPMIFFLLRKRIRDLILIRSGGKPSAKQAWQVQRLATQANQWSLESLKKLYLNLFQIEKNTKTSSMTSSLQKSLETLITFSL